MPSWQSIQSLLIFFGPLLLPRALTYYRSLRAQQLRQPTNPPIRPLPTSTSLALALLFLSATTAFLSTLPLFSPPNIFLLTHSRLQTSGGVLLTRLAALRPLTPTDQHLRTIFDASGLETRLLYAKLGPDALLTCPWFDWSTLTPSSPIPDLAQTLFTYALPSLLLPHVLHLMILGIATSRPLAGQSGSRFRTPAIVAGILLAAAEVYFLATYDDGPNIRSVRFADVDFIHWKIRVWKGLAATTLDAGLGWMVWLSATHRPLPFFLLPLSSSSPADQAANANEKLAQTSAKLESVLGKARGLGVLRNGMVRTREARRKVETYWEKEGEVMRDVFEQEAVLDAQRRALGRLDLGRVEREAGGFVEELLRGWGRA